MLSILVAMALGIRWLLSILVAKFEGAFCIFICCLFLLLLIIFFFKEILCVRVCITRAARPD